jgi:hypothetical protein
MRQAFFWTVLLLGGGTAVDYLLQTSGANVGQPAAPKSPDSKDKPPAAASATQALKVDFQDSQPLSMSQAAASKYRVSFFVKNDEDVEVTISFGAVLQDNDKQLLRSTPTIICEKKNAPCDKVPGNGFDNVTIELDTQVNNQKYSLPLSGYLAMTATGDVKDRKAAHQYRTLKIPPALPSAIATQLFRWALIASACIVVISIIVLAVQGDLGRRMGPPSWNFGDSWGTNITVGGALLTTLLGFSALPEQTHYLNKTAYLCLSLIFAALITIAPSIYALIRTPVTVQGSDTPQFQGYVLPFAVASGVTLWGTLGQLGAVGLLFGELRESQEISQTVLCSLVVLLAAVAILLVIYAFRTIVQTPSKHGSATKLEAAAAPKVAPAAPAKLPNWPVL